MPKGYLIVHVTVHDPEAYAEYVARDTPLVAAAGGRFLVRGGRSELLEGDLPERHVIIEFPSYAAALDFYRSEAYQDVARIRHANAESRLVAVEGFDGGTAEETVGQEPKGYLIAHVDVTDPEGYAPYVARNNALFAAHGARPIVRGGASEVLEGDLPGRHVVIEYPSYRAAREFYDAPDYRENLKIRQASSTGTIVIVEGAGP